MARLIVEAKVLEVQGGTPPPVIEIKFVEHYRLDSITLLVLVMNSDSGNPVVLLEEQNFLVTNLWASSTVPNFKFDSVKERKWDPSDKNPAGIYEVKIRPVGPDPLILSVGYTYGLGIQAWMAEKGKILTPNTGNTIVTFRPKPQGLITEF